jgi:hypothetical protein
VFLGHLRPVEGTFQWVEAADFLFPISRVPPEGGTLLINRLGIHSGGFQFLGIPPKGEQMGKWPMGHNLVVFPISRDPPEGGTVRTPFGHTDPFLSGVSNF